MTTKINLDVFWDNGQWVAIVEDDSGQLHNVARPYCQTKTQAEIDGREHLGIPLTARQQSYQRAHGYNVGG